MTREYLFILDIQKYEQEVLPAIVAFSAQPSVSKLFALARQAYRHEVSFRRGMFLGVALEIAARRLFDRAGATRLFLTELAPELVEALCLLEVNPGKKFFDLGANAYIGYLASSSDFNRALRYCNGGTMAIQLGEGSETYRQDDVARLLHLIETTTPSPDLEAEQLEFRKLLGRVRQDGGLALGMAVF